AGRVVEVDTAQQREVGGVVGLSEVYGQLVADGQARVGRPQVAVELDERVRIRVVVQPDVVGVTAVGIRHALAQFLAEQTTNNGHDRGLGKSPEVVAAPRTAGRGGPARPG